MKKFPLIILAVFVFLVSMKVTATYAIDRGWYYGYFTNNYDSSGDDVFQNNANDGWGHYNGSTGGYDSIPPAVGDANGFISFVEGKLNSTRVDYGTANNATNWDRTGAAFMIQTMIGLSRNRPPTGGEIADWESRVRALDSAGRVNWNTYVCAAPNTFYQISRWDGSSYLNDVAWYNATGCGQAIVFYDGSGNASYIIRRACANPIGDPSPIQAPWSGQGRTTVTDGVSTGTSITVQPGATLTFNHYIKNNGPGVASMWYATYGRNIATTPWTAQYYNNTSLSGAPALTRSEQDINYIDNSGGLSPGPGVIADGFSARWTRTQSFPAGDYLFTMKVDDGGRLYVDGTLILDAWVSQGATPYSITRTLTAGNHTIVLEYFEGGGPGWATLDYTNYLVQGGTNSGSYSSGQEKLVNTEGGVIVPLNTPGGTQYCRRILWDWRNSSGAGEWGLGTAGMGQLACATVISNYNLKAHVIPTIIRPDGTSPPDNYAEPGDSVQFKYTVVNTGGPASNIPCTIYGLTKNGYVPVPSPTDTTSDAGYVQPPHGCPRSYPDGSSTPTTTVLLATPEQVNNLPANKTICRTLVVNPATPGGGPNSEEACVYVAYKPYARVYGGDVVAGGGLENAPSSNNCTATNNTSAAIIGWNRGGAPNNYGGAGVQYAAMALSTIFDTATSLANAAGSATTPTGLSFGNTVTNIASRQFGGSVGAVPCIPDRYPSAAPSGTAISGTTSFTTASNGVYTAGSDITINASAIGAGKHVTVYATGNVFINGAITFNGGGTWTSGTIPSFRLIVKGGNIIVDNDVARLDGLYVAQPNGATGGNIYTCGLASQPYVPLVPGTATFASDCDNQTLTVNGAFSAKRVYLYRTKGTVGQSDATNPPGHVSQAEVFNYSPALWMYQPNDNTSPADYDAIVSLPPVL